MPPAPRGLADTQQNKAARAEVLSLHATDNIIIVLLDNIHGNAARRRLLAKPSLTQAFDGFTLYPNTICPAPSTLYSLPVIYSGDYGVLERTVAPKDLIASLYPDSIFSDAREGGYVPAGALYPPLPQQQFSAISLLDLSLYHKAKNTTLYDFASFYEPCLHRVVPRWAVDKTRRMALSTYHAINRNRTPGTSIPGASIPTQTEGVMPRDMSIMKNSRRALLRWMQNLHVGSPAPRFVFIHTLMTHSPYIFGADGSILPQEDEEQTLEYGMRTMAALNQRLKALGVYETSTIFYISDHGHGEDGQGLNAMILVKEAGAHGALAINPTPAWQPDIRDYLRHILQLPRDGKLPLFAGAQHIPGRTLPVTAYDIPLGRTDIPAPRRTHWSFDFTGSFKNIVPPQTAQ